MAVEDRECVKCKRRNELWAADGTGWLCWDCADAHGINTALMPSPGMFAKIVCQDQVK